MKSGTSRNGNEGPKENRVPEIRFASSGLQLLSFPRRREPMRRFQMFRKLDSRLHGNDSDFDGNDSGFHGNDNYFDGE